KKTSKKQTKKHYFIIRDKTKQKKTNHIIKNILKIIKMASNDQYIQNFYQPNDEENPMKKDSITNKNKNSQRKQSSRSEAYQVPEFSNDVSKSEKHQDISQIKEEKEDSKSNFDNNDHFDEVKQQNIEIQQDINQNQNNIPIQQSENVPTTKNNYSTEQLKNFQQDIELQQKINSSPGNQAIQLNKLQDIDFSDPKNREILEDQFFNNSDNPKMSSEYEKQQEQKNSVIPKKFQYLSLFLAFSGLILIVVGFIVAFSGSDTNLLKGGAFWVIGAICCIPGVYYSVKIYRTRMAKNLEERLEQVQDIPRY
ncbi:transmembrane protein, putative, partial (macronuclear) [Tetrahymena thermophila SB210]